MRARPSLLALWLLATAALAAQSAKQSAPVDTPPSQLKPGQFIWSPAAVPAGPLVMVISLDEQLAYVYRNGLRIGVSTVSTGKPGKDTPTGVFTILQKKVEHRSTLYDDAPMPYMQRLTWDGIALHAGNLPGYPASHGCVRLPFEFARQLYGVTTYGMTVVIASTAKGQAELAHPGLFAPDTAADVTREDVPRLSWYQAYRWTPDKSPSGPLTVLASTADARVLVIRNGVEIGRAALKVDAPAPVGTQAWVLLAGDTGAPSTVVPDRPGKLWQAIPLPGYAAQPGATLDPATVAQVHVSPEFAAHVYDALEAGTTLVLTDAPILPRTTGEAMTVVTAEDGEPPVETLPAEPTPAPEIPPAPEPSPAPPQD